MQKYCKIVKNKLNSIIRKMEKNVADFVVDPKKDFIRKSELSFSKTMKFILGMGSQTLGKELMNFYGFDPKMVSVSAIVQRRSKILSSAFQHLFQEFNKEFTQTRACSHKNGIKNHSKHDDSKKNNIKFIITSANFSKTL